MALRNVRSSKFIVPLLFCGVLAILARLGWAEKPAAQSRDGLKEPVYRVAETPSARPLGGDVPEHPLIYPLKMAQEALGKIDSNIRDYACTFYKRERIDGELGPMQVIYAKVRHEPFSVYMHFLGPADLKGQECLYVEGRNDGKLVGHAGSGWRARLGSVELDPEGMLAMRGQRYPITEMGIRNLTARLIERASGELRFPDCKVQYYHQAKLGRGANARVTTCLEVKHENKRPEFSYHLARIYMDNEWGIPIRYEAYDWPQTPGGKPELTEQYTYMNLKINNGFTDADFDRRNPNYHF